MIKPKQTVNHNNEKQRSEPFNHSYLAFAFNGLWRVRDRQQLLVQQLLFDKQFIQFQLEQLVFVVKLKQFQLVVGRGVALSQLQHGPRGTGHDGNGQHRFRAC